MKVIIAGCGKIGSTIVASLVSENMDVVAIDNSDSVIRELTNTYDVMGVCGNCTDSSVLEEAGVGDAELFTAVTASDEINMLSCFIAGRLGAKHTVARIRNPEYNDSGLGFLHRELGLASSINPEQLTSREIFNILKLPSAAKNEMFASGRFEISELRLKEDSALDGVTLMDLKKKYPGKYLICCVLRDGKTVIPGGMFALKSGDRIVISAAGNEVQRFLKKADLLQKKADDVMIYGGGNTAYYLAKQLIDNGYGVKIIEKDKARCEQLSSDLPGAVIIRCDGNTQDILSEEGIDSVGAFVALTKSDDENILVSIFAQSVNVRKVITKVNSPDLSKIARKLGLESIVSPTSTVTDVIVRYARALKNSVGSNVETLYKIMDGTAEAIEFKVRPDFGYCQVPLKDMKLCPGILIAGIIRGRKTVIPSGYDCIYPGDGVIIISAGRQMDDLSDIIQK